MNLAEYLRTTSIRMIALAVRSTPVLHEDLWAAWPELEIVDVRESENALGMNFDSQFLGIHPEEVECLRKLDDESLGKMNIVPVQPSILTMSRTSHKSHVAQVNIVAVEIPNIKFFPLVPVRFWNRAENIEDWHLLAFCRKQSSPRSSFLVQSDGNFSISENAQEGHEDRVCRRL